MLSSPLSSFLVMLCCYRWILLLHKSAICVRRVRRYITSLIGCALIIIIPEQADCIVKSFHCVKVEYDTINRII